MPEIIAGTGTEERLATLLQHVVDWARRCADSERTKGWSASNYRLEIDALGKRIEDGLASVKRQREAEGPFRQVGTAHFDEGADVPVFAGNPSVRGQEPWRVVLRDLVREIEAFAGNRVIHKELAAALTAARALLGED